MSNEKIIMFDSPEAGRLVTVAAWEVDNPNGMIYTPNEASARYNNCTHKVCDCGKPMLKHYTKCEECREKLAAERYLALPFKEWDGVLPVYYNDGDKYFFSEEELIDYMNDEEIQEIDLLICKPNNYRTIDEDHWYGDAPDEWVMPKELETALAEFNKVLQSLPPISYSPDKIRTLYKIQD